MEEIAKFGRWMRCRTSDWRVVSDETIESTGKAIEQLKHLAAVELKDNPSKRIARFIGSE